ncbi:hypothetical protein ACWGQ5_15875 [Streptomyces sp. NPDC055722]
MRRIETTRLDGVPKLDTLATLTREQHQRNQGGRELPRYGGLTGWFLTIDGPSGIGKSTTVQTHVGGEDWKLISRSSALASGS